MPQDIYSMKLPNEDNDIFLQQWKFRLNLFHTFSNMNVLSWMYFFFARHPVFFYCCTENNVHVSLYFVFNSKQRKDKMFFYGVRLNYAITYHDLPQSTSPHHQPKYIHRHPPPTKIYLPPHTTTQKMDQNIFIYNLLLTLL